MLRFEGKVAFITGAARGQGRSHAVRLAEEGADIIALDLCEQIASVKYPLATLEDLETTVKLVEATGHRIVARQADVRDEAAVKSVVEEGVAELGRLDFVSANAGVFPHGDQRLDSAAFRDALDVMLTGSYYTVQASIPAIMEHGEGGCIVLTSSNTGIRASSIDYSGLLSGSLGYVAAKTGMVGMMKSYANALAPYSIRVNTIHPTGVNTPMIRNDTFREWVAQAPWRGTSMANSIPVDAIEPMDITHALLFLFSDEARYVTGIAMPVDAGCVIL